MKYIVGAYKRDLFIFDSETGICEMKKSDNTDLQLLKHHNSCCSFIKMKMLYNFRERDSMLSKSLVMYVTPIRTKGGIKCDVRVLLRLRIIPCSILKGNIESVLVIACYFLG